jgi:hypothetical protein
MRTISPALEHAFRLLRNDLYLYLDEAEFLTTVDEDWGEDTTESARKLILDLVEVIRRVVAEHVEGDHGDCRFCHRQSWPCPSIQSIHSVLRDPDREFVRLVATSKDASETARAMTWSRR